MGSCLGEDFLVETNPWGSGPHACRQHAVTSSVTCVTLVRKPHYPAGIARQYAAIVASGDRRARVATVKAPKMVIHGADDPLVNIAGGRDTAATIPGAKLLEVPGMGHDLPEPLIPVFLDAFEVVARAAEETA